MDTRKKGKHYEDIASNYLQEKNYKIIDKNFYSQYGEIDIICMSPKKILTFIEVKYSSKNIISLLYKLNTKKIDNMINTSNKFISMYNYNNYQIQYDFIEIIKKNISHYENIITTLE